SVGALVTTVSAPWLCSVTEVRLILPRACKAHKWHQDKFSNFPKECKVIISFLCVQILHRGC
ncbi:hypothetical protein BD309DRAFT_876604, partial [Dichomitus squalens]